MPRRLALVAALIALGAPVLAQDRTGPNVDTAAKGTAGGATTLALAWDLFALGQANGDALTMLSAARLAGAVEVRAGGEVTRAITGAAPATDDEGAAAAPPDAAAMMLAARQMAGEDEVLAGLIEDAVAARARGPAVVAMQWTSRLAAGQSEVWQLPFFGNAYAEIAVLGDGDGNLDLLVTDENGNTVCYDISWSDRAHCDFVPAWNGYFKVTVQNAGTTANSYALLTN